jgi:hypothetical protein
MCYRRKRIRSILGAGNLSKDKIQIPDFLASRRYSMSHIDRFCVRCKSQISEKRVARGSCFCSAECRRQDKIERRRARAQEYAVFATEDFGAKRHPRPPDRLLLSHLPAVRRAHTRPANAIGLPLKELFAPAPRFHIGDLRP